MNWRNVLLKAKSLPASFVSWLTDNGSGGGGADDGGSGLAPGRRLSRPYQKSAWVFRAIQHLSGPITATPIEITDETGEPLAGRDRAKAEAFLKTPVMCAGEKLNRAEAEEALIIWLCLEGEGCLVYDDLWLPAIVTGKPIGVASPLVLVSPRDLRPVASGGELEGWQVDLRHGGRDHLLPGQLGQIRHFNPYEPYRGLAPWAAAEIAAGADYAAARYARNLSEANGDRGDYIFAKQPLQPAQKDQITTALREKRRLATRGEYRPVFLTGDIDVKPPTAQAVDAAFAAQRLANREEIFVAFGVPPSFAQVTASYSVGSASDRYRLIEETSMAIAAKVDGLWSEALSRLLGRPITVARDWDEHSTMQQVRQERIEGAVKLFERGLSWEALDETMRLKLPDFAGKEKRYLPMNFVEVGADATEAGGQKATTAGHGVEDPLADLETLFRHFDPAAMVGRENPSPALVLRPHETAAGSCHSLDCPHCGGKAADAAADDDSATAQLWRKLDAQRNPTRKKFRSCFSRVLMVARRQTLERIAERYRPEESKALIARAGAHELGFDLGSWSSLLGNELANVMRNAIADAVAGASSEIGLDPAAEPVVGVADPNLQAAIAARRQALITQTGVSIWGDVVDTIAEGIEAGDSIKAMSDRLRAKFNGIDEERGLRIAVTETTAIYELARLRTFEQSGVRYKEWLTSRDDRVRDDHVTLDKQRVPIGEPFVVSITGEKLMHPGDHRAPLSLTINCRCVMTAKNEPK